MARVNLKKYDEGRYRLTVVSITGDTRTKLYLSWSKCYRQYEADCKDPLTQYAIIVNQSDMDGQYWVVKEEYHRVWRPRLW
jgi:hypothetical protein